MTQCLCAHVTSARGSPRRYELVLGDVVSVHPLCCQTIPISWLLSLDQHYCWPPSELFEIVILWRGLRGPFLGIVVHTKKTMLRHTKGKGGTI